MIIKSLKLKNIRSYLDGTVDFPLGTTLFEGDIGSGKSTILMAIEFALFGLGSEKGGALLRAGTKQGSVSLRFEVDGQEFEIFRSLERKGKGIQFGEADLTTKEGVISLSAKEMKEKVLEILNFNEPPDPKAQSMIYRYAVFTPQEEMKAILWMRPDSRLQTLRKAFRIEDYRIAVSNALSLAKLIENGAKELAAQATDLEEKADQRKLMVDETAKDQNTLGKLRKEEQETDDDRKKLKADIDSLRDENERLVKVTGEIPLLKNSIEEKKDRVKQLEEGVKESTTEMDEEILPSIDELKKISKPTSKSEEDLETELEELKKQEKKLSKEEGRIEQKVTDYESIQLKKKCPTCDRPVNPEEFKQRIELKKTERERISNELGSCREAIIDKDTLQKELRKFNETQEQLKQLNKRLKKNKGSVEANNEEIKALRRQVEDARARLENANKEMERHEQISIKIDALKDELNTVEEELGKIRDAASSTEATIKLRNKQVEALASEIVRKESQRKLAEQLNEYYVWLDGFFVPTLDNIEKHVMLAINQEFNQHFQKWFGWLIEDPGKEGRIDEDFTPIVEQDGYEQDINYLSGGEKTSVALAYRLALNSIVQRVSIGMKSNLLILDEPTDGLSKDQLFKVREILNEIKCPQVIIVSHETELESFADQVIKVEKTQGVSRVTS